MRCLLDKNGILRFSIKKIISKIEKYVNKRQGTSDES